MVRARHEGSPCRIDALHAPCTGEWESRARSDSASAHDNHAGSSADGLRLLPAALCLPRPQAQLFRARESQRRPLF